MKSGWIWGQHVSKFSDVTYMLYFGEVDQGLPEHHGGEPIIGVKY